MNEEIKKHSVSIIIIILLVVIVAAVLVFLFYFFAKTNNVPVYEVAPAKQIIPTNVITFEPPAVLPSAQQSGNCWTSSVAEPYRQDAWRCMVENGIYDPCFSTAQNNLVFCPVDPSKSDSVLIKITAPLPKPFAPETIKNNWAWFLKLEDGTYCSPFTGTLPPLKNEMAYFGCSGAQGSVLIGDLTEGNVWTAKKAILAQSGQDWVIKSEQQVNIDTVWK